MKSLVDQKLLTASVTNVMWERIHLSIEVKITYEGDIDQEKPLDFYAVDLVEFLNQVHFRAERTAKDRYLLRINITSAGNNRCIPSGVYGIFVCQGDQKLAECVADTCIIDEMGNMSRSFLYGAQKKVYSVNFYIEEGSENFPFRMSVLSASQNNMEFGQRARFFAGLHIWGNFRKAFLSSRQFLKRCYAMYARKKHDPNVTTILFLTEHNDELTSNLKAVYDRMVERGLDKQFRILINARAAAARSQSKISWIRAVRDMARSDIIFVDDHVGTFDWLKLTDRTMVIQLWHAGAGFKSSGYSRWGHLGCPAPISSHRQYTYGIAGSKNIAPFFSEVWGMSDELVLPTGMPRMDEYLDKERQRRKTEELYQQFPICKGKKVMLFAPTYRGMNQSTAYYPYELIDFERLYRECGDEYVVLLKVHPWVNNTLTIEKKYRDKFLDVKNYPDINDLFYITDLLITDYSSNIFEYSLMKKPMMFFAYDKVQYSFSRGFHRDYEESAPGKVCYTFDALMDAFAARDFEFEKVQEYIDHHFDYIDSGASDRVINWFLLGEMPKQFQDEIAAVREDWKRTSSLDFLPEHIGEKTDVRMLANYLEEKEE